MEKRVSWEVRLVGLLGVLWWFVHPWIVLSYVPVPRSVFGNFIVGAWALIGWFAGGYGLLKAAEALHRIGLTPEEKLMETVREAIQEYSKETGETVAITVSQLSKRT
jgi:hypothetical protein